MTENDLEIKPIKGFPDYFCDKLGNIYSSKGKFEFRKLKPASYRGYLKVCLSISPGVQKMLSVHRAIAEAFLPNPTFKATVNHINGIKTDNRLENLEWATYSEQQFHAFETGLRSHKGESHPASKLSNDQVLFIRVMIDQGHTHKSVSKMFNVSRGTITKIHNRQIWAHV